MTYHEASAIIIAIIVAIIGIWKFKSEFKARNELESAKFIFEINKRFYEDQFRKISREIGEDVDGKKSLDINDDDKKYEIWNYLSELESICEFHLEGILTEKQTYELLGNQILEAFRCKMIREFIDHQRTLPDEGDLYDRFQTVAEKMFDYQKKKLSENNIEKLEDLFQRKSV